MPDVQARFKITPTLVALPGQCGGCGSSDSNRQYLDVDKDFEYYGALVYCELCVADMAAAFGYIIPAEADRIKTSLVSLTSERDALQADLNAARTYIATISSQPRGSGISSANLSSVLFSVDDPACVEAQPTVISDGAEAAVDADEPGPDDISEFDKRDLAGFDL